MVTLPVAFSGTVTVTVAFSPTLISETVTLIGASSLGILAVAFTVPLM